METAIRVDRAVTTLVNVFTRRARQSAEGAGPPPGGYADDVQPDAGWISTSLLKSRDGRQVVVYSQWRDGRDIEAFRQDPRMKPYFEQFGALAKHEAFTCDVSYSLHAEAQTMA